MRPEKRLQSDPTGGGSRSLATATTNSRRRARSGDLSGGYCQTLAVVSLLALAGCAVQGSRVTEYLDPQTAVTIRAMSVPFVYAHEVPAIAANVRDYLSLGAIEVNNMGTRKHYLVLVSWSTVDRAGAHAGRAPLPERVAFTVGGRTLELAPVSHEARSLGIGEPPYRPPSGYVGESWYAVTPAQLRALSAAPPAEIALQQEADSETYVTWRGATAELEEFVRDIPASPADSPRR
jgi:hypothetical protein